VSRSRSPAHEPRTLLSGEQYEIAAGEYRAVAVEVGGGLRELTYAGRALVDGYAADALADGGRGGVLAPQVFTGDTLAADRRRRGVAVEPMTAPANALASGDGLTLLEPGQALALRWGVLAL